MNNIDLNARSAIVTGGADGIGQAITERFLASGASVLMWDISQKNLDKIMTFLQLLDNNILITKLCEMLYLF